MPICISFMVYNVAHVDFAFVNKLLQIYDMVYMRHGVPDVLCSFDKQDNSCLAMKITIVIMRVLALVMSWQLVYSGEWNPTTIWHSFTPHFCRAQMMVQCFVLFDKSVLRSVKCI